MERWYVACYRPGKGSIYKAMLALSHINGTAFCPQIRTYRPRADRPGQSRQIIEPLFPGYFFVSFDPAIIHTSRIEQCPGVSHLLRNAGSISPINDKIVDEIMNLPVCENSRTHHNAKRNQRIVQKLNELVKESDGEVRGAMFLAFLEIQESRK